jgi:hypothetical protein
MVPLQSVAKSFRPPVSIFISNTSEYTIPDRTAHCLPASLTATSPTGHLPHESPNQTPVQTRRKSVQTRRNAQNKRTMVSRRACDAALPEGVTETTKSVDGCSICTNKGRYGRGTSVCGQCGRCHGCGSSNNGIGPLQATYFGLRSVVRKVDEQLRGGEEDKEKQKDGKAVGEST